MKRVSLLCAVAAAAVLMVPSAKADTFSISFNGGPVGFSGGGVFDATSTGAGAYTITAVESGSVSDPFLGTSSIVSLSNTFAEADNLLSFPSATYFDDDGLSFNLANGLSVNLFFDGFNEGALRSDGAAELVTDTVTSGAVATTPEPSSFVLLGSAAVMGMGALRKRQVNT